MHLWCRFLTILFLLYFLYWFVKTKIWRRDKFANMPPSWTHPPGQFDEDPTTWDLTWKFCPIVLFLSTHRRSIWEDVNVWMNDHLLITLSISNEYSDWNTGTGMTGFIGTNRTQGDQLEEMVTSESHCQSRLSNPIDKEWHWDGRWSAEAAACNIALLTPYWRLHYPEWVVPGYSQTQCPGTKCNIALLTSCWADVTNTHSIQT